MSGTDVSRIVVNQARLRTDRCVTLVALPVSWGCSSSRRVQRCERWGELLAGRPGWVDWVAGKPLQYCTPKASKQRACSSEWD